MVTNAADLLYSPAQASCIQANVLSKYCGNSSNASLPSYEDICVIKMLNKAKYSVYLASSRNRKQQYAMKVFPLEHGKSQVNFTNEVRFAFLDHPNVTKIVHFEHKKNILNKGPMSYILMEFAPHGDFFDLFSKIDIKHDEKLIRTYFKQLIQGMAYLHNQGVAHLDLKLENLLVGENYKLKITDFDLSYKTGDEQVLSRGTKFYRAPEVINGRSLNHQASDIYSAGVILFIMKTGGIMPHFESTPIKGINFFELQYDSNEKFWEEHYKFHNDMCEDIFPDDFKELFHMMTKYHSEERATLQDIVNSRWYQGEVYTDQELIEIMRTYL